MELYVYGILMLVFTAIFTREVIAPASQNTCDRRWLILASIVGGTSILVALGIGFLFSDVIQPNAIFQAERYLPSILVGVLCFLATSFIFYWWHRATHHFDLLWRVFHQLHHSAKRVEVLTAFYAHPLDTVMAVLINACTSYLLLGASPLAVAVSLLLTGLFDFFVHSDIRTPKWLGYIVQRPEMHTIHHQQGHHAQNYGLPIWDLMFRTWANPQERVRQLGFEADRSQRITDMLLWQDVHKTTYFAYDRYKTVDFLGQLKQQDIKKDGEDDCFIFETALDDIVVYTPETVYSLENYRQILEGFLPFIYHVDNQFQQFCEKSSEKDLTQEVFYKYEIAYISPVNDEMHVHYYGVYANTECDVICKHNEQGDWYACI